MDVAVDTKPDHQLFVRAMGSMLKGFRGASSSVSDANLNLEQFASRRLYVATKSGALVPLNPWAIQVRYEAMKQEGRRLGYRHFFLLKYRRGGFTSWEVADDYKTVATKPHVKAAVVAQTDSDTSSIFEIANRFYENDPLHPFRPRQNLNRLHFTSLDSQLIARTAKGEHPLRGATLMKFHASEFAFWYPGSDPSKPLNVLKAIMLACSNGETVVETTPNGRNAAYHLWRGAKERSNSFYPIFMPWYFDKLNRAPEGSFDPEEITDTLSEEERHLMDVHGVDLPMMAFRRAKQLELGPLFKQEFPETDVDCFLSTGHHYLNTDLIQRAIRFIERRLSGPHQIKYEDTPGGYIVLWEPVQQGVSYTMASDCSEGTTTGDPNGGKIIRDDTAAEVGAWHGRFTPHEHYAIGDRLGRLYNNAMWAIERENFGYVVIDRAITMGYPNLWSDSGKAGWSTNAVSRPQMLNTVREWLIAQHAMDYSGVWDLEFLDECLSFKKQSDGGYAADSGAHDDAFMKTAIALDCRRKKPGPLGVYVPGRSGHG